MTSFFVSIAIFAGATIILGLVVSLPVMILWNYCLLAAVPGLNEITWLQAWGILILTSLLFKTNISKNSD